MGATVYSRARWGVVDDETATGLKLANLSYNATTEEGIAEDHIGCDMGVSIYNDKSEVSADGVVAVLGTGVNTALASVIALANEDNGGVNLATKPLFTSSHANAGTIITSLDVTRANKAFETGSLSGMYRPLVNTDSPTILT
eukprot:Seg12982.5 transcript_id=Seg12982.5/GoldUCD/mRNA.D3Y31 product="hypothetical protein" protein_id=Seg12982.5/GoldUCD/D3Y31